MMGRAAGALPILGLGLGVHNLDLTFRKADGVDLSYGVEYYERFHSTLCRISARNGEVPISTVTAVFAALSPNNSEDTNLEDCERALQCYRNNSWPQFKPRTYGKNKAKAFQVLEGEAPDSVIKGLKTWNFYHNILEPNSQDYVTIDGHMANIWQGIRRPLDFAGISRNEYRLIQSGVMELAVRKNLLPCQLQAILWLTWRRVNRILYKPQMKLNLGEC